MAIFFVNLLVNKTVILIISSIDVKLLRTLCCDPHNLVWKSLVLTDEEIVKDAGLPEPT